MNFWPFSRKSANGVAMGAPGFAALLSSIFGGGASKSGASVNAATALEVSAFLCGVRVIAEGVAQVPWKVMRKEPGKRERLDADNHPLWDILHRKPNRWQTSFSFRETLILHVLASEKGSAYAYVSRVGANRRIKELVLIEPQRIQEQIAADGTLTYLVTGRDGSQRPLQEADVWQIRGPSWDGITALSIMRLAREALGLSMATEETQAKLHKDGVRPKGSYSVEGSLDKKGYEDLAEWVQKQASTNGFLVLDRNAKWLPHAMTGVDAQHLETRAFQIREVARFLRVQPIMLMEAEKAMAYASSEQQFIAHVVHCLLPWYERIEQSADVFLLGDDDRAKGYYTLLDPKGLLRGSLKDTADFISRLTERGVMVRNEGREMLDLNPLPGLDEPLTPINLAVGTEPHNEPAPADA